MRWAYKLREKTLIKLLISILGGFNYKRGVVSNLSTNELDLE